MPEIQWVDAEGIESSETLWRMVNPVEYIQREGDNLVVSNGAFRTKEMSVWRASLAGLQQLLERFPGYCVAEINAALVRSPEVNCILVSDPEDNAHVIVCP